MKSDKENKDFWKCLNDQCDYKFAKIVTDNDVELIGSKGEKFIVNYLRIIVTCPKCGRPQMKKSMLSYDIVEWLLDKNGINLNEKEGLIEALRKIELKMHAISSSDEAHKVFPLQSIKLDKTAENFLRQKLTEQERRAYEIMLDGENKKMTQFELIQFIVKTLKKPMKEAELLYSKVISKIEEVKNHQLKTPGATLVGNDDWWRLY